jgi:hypothetical protein
MQEFWNWLIGEAGAGWIFGIAGVIGILYSWQKRERPPYIIIEETQTLRLLNIHSSQDESLEIYYSTEPGSRQAIRNLIQKEFVIYNSGTRDISEHVRLEFKTSLSYIDLNDQEATLIYRDLNDQEAILSLASSFDQTVFTLAHDESKKIKGFSLEIPYLNSYLTHKQCVKVYLITNQYFKLELVKGIGKGWSSKFISLIEVKQTKRMLRLWISWIGIFLVAIFLLSFIFHHLTFITGYIGQAQLNPTPENIRLALQAYQERLESLQKISWIERLLLLNNPPPRWFGFAFMTLCSLYYFLARGGENIVSFLSHKYLGSQPLSIRDK